MSEPPSGPEQAVVERNWRSLIEADPLLARLASEHPEAFVDAVATAGDVTVELLPEHLLAVAGSLKRGGFTYLVNLAGVDYSTYPGYVGSRFAVVCHAYSFQENRRIGFKVRVAEGESVPSLTSVWKTADWQEREVFDMFGIAFTGHPNLERILMWDEFNGHPLRKDFPLRGIDTGARIYPEVFAEGEGPQSGSTGKSAGDVNRYEGVWNSFGTAPPADAGAAAIPEDAAPSKAPSDSDDAESR